ncbi:MAG: regulatory protein RecX [Balneolaceae bacterium]|nr:regulatory protein RecX [Balneolaceae bacterium]MCH8547279.1 recombination regulator RecX [Balneolaceae bacterium]
MPDPDKILQKLPLKITSVAPQKKRRDRYSLFHEKTFLIGISGKTLTDFSITSGKILTPNLFQQLTRSEDLQKLRDYFYRLLGRRDHASFELRQKARKKGYPDEDISLLIEELDQKGLINDLAYAQKFASDKQAFNKWGPKKIKNALFGKGIAKHTVEKVVQNLSEDLAQDQICVDLLRKRRRHFSREDDTIKRKQKMIRYLLGKGYGGEPARRAANILTDELDA